ncbi:hypothetical protein EA772_01335 [Pedobacter sp. G11]|uniref:hypothetical protein n=1 Tax=Pedobacter sp. G11 TaxID=2482728 RepID=UPI000F5E6F52|nr:hypothetical protein [Pedobacter sp. G11]AZI24051.1 hypothetical protein EA772_01335 [Pedobacter sp. G11]
MGLKKSSSMSTDPFKNCRMKRITLLFSISFWTGLNLNAQSNLFPPTGNVGLGTSNPENIEGWDKVLDLYGNSHSKFMVRSSGITGGFWSHLSGFYGAPAGSMAGTVSNHPFSLLTNSTPRLTALSNGNLGIGTTNPSSLLELFKENERFHLTLSGNGDVNAYADIIFNVKNPVNDFPQRINSWVISHRKDGYFSDNPSGQSSLEFYSVMNNGSYAAPLSFKSNGDLILASNKNAIGGNVGIGTNIPDAKLAVNGLIHTKEVKVDLQNWPDYVFDEKYKIWPLEDLERYIKVNRHLPDVPTAIEVEKNGVKLGEMNKVLLKKIEEITLHLIAKDQEMRHIKASFLKIQSEQSEISSTLQLLVKEIGSLKKRNR